MNTANPQLEGLYLAISALVRRMIEKGILDAEDLHQAMSEARQAAEQDLETSSLSEANRKAVLFRSISWTRRMVMWRASAAWSAGSRQDTEPFNFARERSCAPSEVSYIFAEIGEPKDNQRRAAG